MNYIFEPVNKTQLKEFLKRDEIKDIIVGIKGLTHGHKLKLTIEEINEFLTYSDIISLDVTRLFHEDELNMLDSTLKMINLAKIKYIFYSDFAVLETLHKLMLDNKAVYDTYTYSTNSEDINILSKINKYVVISNQISIDEIKKLLTKVNRNVMIHGFGRSVIFYSKRELLTNYFNYRNLSYDARKNNYSLKEEFREEFYPIYEDEYGTYIYEKGYYYLFEELKTFINVDYVIIHSALLDSKEYENIVNCYLKYDFDKFKTINLDISKGIMKNKSVLLKNEEINDE